MINDIDRRRGKLGYFGTEENAFYRNGLLFTDSIPFLESKLQPQYTCSCGGADLCLPKIVRYEVGRQGYSRLFATKESVLQVVEIIWNTSAMEGRVTLLLAECRIARNLRAKKTLFQCFRYNCHVSRTIRNLKKGCEERSADSCTPQQIPENLRTE